MNNNESINGRHSRKKSFNSVNQIENTFIDNRTSEVDDSLQKIIVWGSNLCGQLGLGNCQEKVIIKPLKMPFLRTVLTISVG